jgi:plastocyanin
MSRRARTKLATMALCLLCALLVGGTCALAALAQTQARVQAPPSAQAHSSAKQRHTTKRSGCVRNKRHHAKHAKRCRSRHTPARPAKPLTPAPLTPAALLSVPPAPAAPIVPAPLASPVDPSPAPATTPSEPPPSESPGEVEPPSVPHVQVSAVEYSFTLSRASVPAGKVILQFVNDGQDEHNLQITEGEEGPLAGSFADTPSKGVGQLQLEMRSGSYTLFCSLHGHEAKGMKATLTVE